MPALGLAPMYDPAEKWCIPQSFSLGVSLSVGAGLSTLCSSSADFAPRWDRISASLASRRRRLYRCRRTRNCSLDSFTSLVVSFAWSSNTRGSRSNLLSRCRGMLGRFPLAACALAGCSVALLWALLGDLLARDLTFRLCCDSLCSRHDVGGGAATSLSVRDAFRCKTLRKKRVAACCSAVGSLATVVWCSSPSWGSSCATFDLYSAELRYWFNRRSAGKQPPVTTTSKNACVALGYRHAL